MNCHTKGKGKGSGKRLHVKDLKRDCKEKRLHVTDLKRGCTWGKGMLRKHDGYKVAKGAVIWWEGVIKMICLLSFCYTALWLYMFLLNLASQLLFLSACIYECVPSLSLSRFPYTYIYQSACMQTYVGAYGRLRTAAVCLLLHFPRHWKQQTL